MMEAVLSNADHPEYGVATIPLPIPRNQYDHCVSLLEALEIGDASEADCRLDSLDSAWPVLNRLVCTKVNLDELDYLAKRLDSFTVGEFSQFQAMAEKLNLASMKDLINLTFCCQQATVITDFTNLKEIGRDHYMNIHGGCASMEELEQLDGEETAILLIEDNEGTVTRYGVVYDNGMQLSQLYDGKHLPCYHYEADMTAVGISTRWEPENSKNVTWVYLPASKGQIERAMQRSGIADPKDMRLFMADSSFPEEVDVALDFRCDNIHELNELALVVEKFSIHDRKKLGAAVSMAKPENASQIRRLAENMDQLCDNPVIEKQMRQLVQALETTTGKKQYGYLKKPLKALVDTIVDELARQPEVAKCYETWNQIRDELNECYGSRTPREHLPLSQQKEFRRIKNDIIREAENIRLGLPTFEDEKMQDEPEPEAAHEEQRSSSVYEQARRYRAAKTVLQDVYALDEEHTEAVRALEQLWAEGYTVAAHQLGKFYRDDLSTMRDHEKAERWFRLSAEAGNDFSEYALGKLLLSQKRTGEAVRWLDKAARHGNPFAQYRLGKLCLTGESVKKDVRKALEYLTAAARQGNPFAQYTLGKLYLLGRDVEQDREQARDWFTRSAAQGNAYAQFFLDRFDQFRDPSVMLAATKLLHHMSRIFRDNSMPPRNPAGIRIDSKRRKRLTEKRMAMGHKADDHEEQVSYQQTM